jgi:hypothetical protein
LATIQADLAGLAADVERPITYKAYRETTPGDPALGIKAVDHFDDLSITATVRELTIEEVQTSNGVYTLGDLEFGVRRPTMDPRDLVVYGGATWRITEPKQATLAGVVIKWILRCTKA